MSEKIKPVDLEVLRHIKDLVMNDRVELAKKQAEGRKMLPRTNPHPGRINVNI